MMQLKKEPEKNADQSETFKLNITNARRRRMFLWLFILVFVVSVLTYLLQPKAIVVDLHEVKKEALIVSIDEEGQTQVRDIYTFSAPVAGKLDRINLKVGDTVKAYETPIVVIHPSSPAYLDIRSEKQAQAAVDTAKSARSYARAELERIQSDLDFSKSEYQRAQQLRQHNVIPAQQLEDAEHVYKVAQASLASAHAAVQMKNFELKQAEVMLMPTTALTVHGENCQCVPLTSPINGKVLKVYDPSSRTINTSEALIDIGDASDLEIVVDLLSADAVQVQVGNRVLINDWGGEQVLEGRVRRIEPFGFTKVSALGIEEQRVNVLIDLTSEKELWQRLGHGYQVGLRVVLWAEDEVITVPLTAAFRKTLAKDKGQQDAWAVFVIEEGKIRVRDITLGHRSGLNAEVTSGLSVAEKVVLHPSNKVVDGVRVVARSDSF
jgi:HlyD family secretion protein